MKVETKLRIMCRQVMLEVQRLIFHSVSNHWIYLSYQFIYLYRLYSWLSSGGGLPVLNQMSEPPEPQQPPKLSITRQLPNKDTIQNPPTQDHAFKECMTKKKKRVKKRHSREDETVPNRTIPQLSHQALNNTRNDISHDMIFSSYIRTSRTDHVSKQHYIINTYTAKDYIVIVQHLLQSSIPPNKNFVL